MAPPPGRGARPSGDSGRRRQPPPGSGTRGRQPGGSGQPRRATPERGERPPYEKGGSRDDRRGGKPAPAPLPPQARRWGGVSRRGARVVTEPGTASAAWQDAVTRSKTRETGAPAHPRADAKDWKPEVWVQDDLPRSSQPKARNRRERPLPPEVVREIDGVAPRRAPGLQKRLADAVRAYEADRYRDALRILKPLVEAAPASAAIRELNGLTLYRLGRWRATLPELQAAHALSGSFDQHPVMADCARALGRHRAVGQRWEELRHAGVSGEVLAEGRIVMAGSLADQGRVEEAIALLQSAAPDRARPKEHHLRSWYALADLHERAGDIPHARELFRRIAKFDAGFHDVAERLSAL